MSLAVKERQQTAFARGFKAWSENTAESIRDRLSVRRVDPLPPLRLAQDLDVFVWTPADVPGLPAASLAYLTSGDGDEWSAVTIRVGRSDIIVLNPLHSPARQASDLAHELAHILRNHEPAQILMLPDGMVGLRTFNEMQEAEADWLAGCLLLPRAALAYCASRGMDRQAIAARFGVSEDLVRYRLGVTGVSRQYS